ncbi:aminotransferase class IV [Xanthovirga aplysinae]|uniref:aminotransferase class IV n=1 Tax=Xanthovirga aplysinae TaxID=2529853 RepID=UPI0012BBFCBD|nr:aminotransferase class IV [Xanthovirga aplysinae]MTI33131.1 aminotransferase IV [Xanthovirga aplysinae]
MHIIYNLKVEQESDAMRLLANNRAFQYGDGLFETMILQDGTIRFLPWHLERLVQGMKVLKMEAEKVLDAISLQELVGELIVANELKDKDCRIKLQVWRKSGGLYTPKSHGVEKLMTVKPFISPKSFVKEQVAFAESVQLNYSPFSRFKSCNALPYVLAGIEREERQLDDLILTDQQGFISECCSANIFWRVGDNWFTPSLETGCVDGIMRRAIIQKMKKNASHLLEVKAKKVDLMEANEVFCCNVTGIYPIREIEGREFELSTFQGV